MALPLAALALAGTGVAAYGAVADDSARYRTVEATIGDVEQELTLSGVIAPSGRSDLEFGTDGTVARVKVEQGDEVSQGEVIAVLDRASLRAAVDGAASELADAKAQLAQDLDDQASAVSTATSSGTSDGSSAGSSTSGRGSGGTSEPSAGATKVLADLTVQQDAVLAAQTAASSALATASSALTAQQAVCTDPAVVTTQTSAVDGEEETSSETTTSTAVLGEDCSTALTSVQSAQTAASEAQTVLQKALMSLGSTLTQALGTADTGAGSDTPAASATPAATSDTAASPASSGGSASASRTVTAATLAQDQASIDRAVATIAAAKADLTGAVVRAPADGTVAALSAAAGDDVSAGDTVATVVAPGLTTVAVEVTVAQAAQLAVGSTVQVIPAGATDPLPGEVGRVNHTASATSTGSTTYAVEIVLDARNLALADGMTATVTAVVGSAEDVVVLPASAINDGTVTVLDDQGRAQRVRVTTGVVGGTAVEILDGVDEGAEVVLADLDAALPTGDTDTQGTGGFGGFGGGGGGFTGGPPGGGRPTR